MELPPATDDEIRATLREFGWHPHPNLAGDGVVWKLGEALTRTRKLNVVKTALRDLAKEECPNCGRAIGKKRTGGFQHHLCIHTLACPSGISPLGHRGTHAVCEECVAK